MIPLRLPPVPQVADSPSEIASALAVAAMERGQAALSAGDPAGALRWFDRLRRLAPAEPIADFLRATALLHLRDRSAVPLLQELAAAHDVREVWTALAAAARQQGDIRLAAEAMAVALGRHALAAVPGAPVMAIARAADFPGWCGISGSGVLHAGVEGGRRLRIRLDGQDLPARLRNGAQRLPAGWESARCLTVECAGVPLLGSPVDLSAIRRLEGCVLARDGGLEIWAWHPNDPDTDPPLLLRDPTGRERRITLSEPATFRHPRLLARPRRLWIPAGELRNSGSPLHVLAPDGRDLSGSPLDPGEEQRAALDLAQGIAARHMPGRGRSRPAPVPAGAPVWVMPRPPRGPARSGSRTRRVLVIAAPGMRPDHLDGIRASLPRGTKLTALEPADPEETQAVNAALRAGAGRDVVLLQPGFVPVTAWLDRLRDVACAAADTGTASPLSAGTGLLGLSGRGAGPAAVRALDRLSRGANGAAAVEIPWAGGPCVYIRGDCLAETGLLRQDAFPRLPAALADFCLRARHFGWAHVAATGLVAGEWTETADDPAQADLRTRDAEVLDRLHPGRQELLLAGDPLKPARRRIDLLRWRRSRARAGSVVLVTHAEGGGVERLVQARAAAMRAEGRRPVILRPAQGGCAVEDGEVAFPDLRFALPDELPALVRLLKAERPSHLELHHMLGHAPVIAGLPRLLGVPADVFVHDYAAFCPRIALVGPERRYCGEPDVAQCALCVADAGSNLGEEIAVAELRARSAAQLAAARQVIAPSADAAQRIRRHFPRIRPAVLPWEDDAALPPAPPARPPRPACRVVVIGAIGVEKGYEVLLACARDAATRGLKLEFVVVGHTIDDAKLIDTGRVFITGAYSDAEAVELIRAQDADISFIPSIWPETWCYTLSHAWRAGLDAAAFDIGAQAERIRRTGRGWLLPLGLQAAAINNAFVTGTRLACDRTSSHHPAQNPPGREFARAGMNSERE